MKGESDQQTKWQKAVRQNKIIALLIIFIALGLIVGLILIFTLSDLLIEKERDFRLPTSLVPTHYSLEVKPYLVPDKFKFDGKVEIKVSCQEDTDEIVLHFKDLEIQEEDVKVQDANGERLQVLRIKYDKRNQFMILQLLQMLKQNQTYGIFISYEGTLREDGIGFFVSSHEDSNGDTHYVAATQFHAFNARTTFPCFDEPGLKAKFDITVVRWKNMTSLSNMNRVKIESRGEHWLADIFQTTPKMSTHFVAFFIGDYEGRTRGKVSIWSSRDDFNNTQFALETSMKLLKFYEGFFPNYVLPKLDLVTVKRLNYEAMENWGLIISSREHLLHNENDPGQTFTKQRVSTVLAREIAHQWFGTLVTPKWWSDIWLSEGLSIYMEHIASKALFAQWYQIDKTTTTLYERLVGQDCDDVGTVHKTINKETSDSDIFDIFTHLKGVAVIRMAHEILGDNVFWKGLSNYLEKYAYDVAEEKDLWDCLTKAQYTGGTPQLNMSERMMPWTHLPGLPIINVERDYDRKTATLSQISCNRISSGKGNGGLWHVPISYTTSEIREWNPSISMWLTDRFATLKDMPNEKQWILVNVKGAGYYLVNYDRTNWNLLAMELRKHHERFPLEDRFKILADANLLEKKGLITMDTVMDLSLFIAKETKLSILSYPSVAFVWRTFVLIEQGYYMEGWKNYMLYLFEPAYKILRRNHSAVDVPEEVQELVPSIVCALNYTPCTREIMSEFEDWKARIENDTKNIENQLFEYSMYPKLCYAVTYGNSSHWEFIYDLYLETEYIGLLEPLACSMNATLVRKLLRLVFHENRGRGVHVIYKLWHFDHWEEFLAYLNQHFDEIAKDDRQFEALLTVLGEIQGPVKYEQFLATCKKFLKRLSGSKYKELKKTLDGMEEKLPKLEKQKEIVESWLEKKPWLKQV